MYQSLQRWRKYTQTFFFILFLIAPVFNIFRFDLNEQQFWFFGMRWSLGLEAFQHGKISVLEASTNVLFKGIIPVVSFIVLFLGIAFRYGRLYCGWLCPHFSSVELLNTLLHRACGKLSFWEKLPVHRQGVTPNRQWWPVFGLSCLIMGFVWAITLLTYLQPPLEIWFRLFSGTLSLKQTLFLIIGTTVLTIEFIVGRHLFCRYACSVGLFQSLAWMANPRAMEVTFHREQAKDCKTCRSECSPPAPGNACDDICPMRLQPRTLKRKMFSCVQCGLCLSACETTQSAQNKSSSLSWKNT
ncbi:MAG: hypothetical protein RLZZ495_247 [Pseudomonadota bacterium]|jgi:polyferredoxin